MKQIMAIMIMGMFLFSMVPEVVAENTYSRQMDQRLIDGPGPKLQKLNEDAIKKYHNFKNRYTNVEQEWSSLREDYNLAKNKVNRFNSLEDEDKEKVIENLRNFLVKTIERMEAHLDLLKGWVDRVVIDETREEIIIDAIEDKAQELEDLKFKVREADNVESLRELSKEIKETWHGFVPKVKKFAAEVFYFRSLHVVERAQSVSEHLEEKIDQLDQGDESVEKMQILLDEFDNLINQAVEELRLAKEAHQGINTLEDVESNYGAAKEHLANARDYLRQAHEVLRDLVSVYREYVGEVPIRDAEDLEQSLGNVAENE